MGPEKTGTRLEKRVGADWGTAGTRTVAEDHGPRAVLLCWQGWCGAQSNWSWKGCQVVSGSLKGRQPQLLSHLPNLPRVTSNAVPRSYLHYHSCTPHVGPAPDAVPFPCPIFLSYYSSLPNLFWSGDWEGHIRYFHFGGSHPEILYIKIFNIFLKNI